MLKSVSQQLFNLPTHLSCCQDDSPKGLEWGLGYLLVEPMTKCCCNKWWNLFFLSSVDRSSAPSILCHPSCLEQIGERCALLWCRLLACPEHMCLSLPWNCSSWESKHWACLCSDASRCLCLAIFIDTLS
jgi:hypothetical protein